VASKDTSGWQSLGGNDPTKYQATLNYNNGTIAPSGQQGKTDVVVTTNRSNGNYDVYKKTFLGNKLIYQYNASNDKTTIVNQADFDDFFTGKNSQQYTNLNQSVKQATLDLAEENLSGSTSRKEYQELQQQPGYKSLSNTVDPPAVVELEVVPLSGGEEQRSGSSSVDNGTLTGGDMFTGSSDAFLVPVDGFSNLSGFTDFGSLGDDAFLGTADDITAAGDSFAASLGISNTKLDLNDPFYTRKFAEDGEVLKYPEADLTSFGYDYIQITGHKYTTKNTNGFGQSDSTGVFNNSFKNYSVSSKLGQVTKIIQLPMQPGLSESNAVDWTQDEINEIQRRAAGIAGNAINGIRGSDSLGDLGTVFANLLGNTGEAAQQLINDNGLAPFITAYFAGQAVGANVVGRSTGQVLNKNLELLFKGPKLRQFSFNFTFTPRTDTEAATVKEIIRFFKRSMAPQIAPQRLFLYTPDIFQLKYIHNNGEDHPFMNRFKPCALTNFSANYTPGNSYMTYKDGSMTQYQVTMTFSELEPIYQSDHDVAGGTGF
jgi:hypothetical protein